MYLQIEDSGNIRSPTLKQKYTCFGPRCASPSHIVPAPKQSQVQPVNARDILRGEKDPTTSARSSRISTHPAQNQSSSFIAPCDDRAGTGQLRARTSMKPRATSSSSTTCLTHPICQKRQSKEREKENVQEHGNDKRRQNKPSKRRVISLETNNQTREKWRPHRCVPVENTCPETSHTSGGGGSFRHRALQGPVAGALYSALVGVLHPGIFIRKSGTGPSWTKLNEQNVFSLQRLSWRMTGCRVWLVRYQLWEASDPIIIPKSRGNGT